MITVSIDRQGIEFEVIAPQWVQSLAWRKQGLCGACGGEMQEYGYYGEVRCWDCWKRAHSSIG